MIPYADKRTRPRDMSDRFVIILVAVLMGLHSLGVDAMLPALPQIGKALNVHSANETQWVISAYLLGFGCAQIIMGPLADRFGRRPVLLTGLALYTVLAVVAGVASTFALLLAARVAQGGAAAAIRIMATTMVRDRFDGPHMARAMSLAMMVFLAAPILAPSVGQAVLFVAPWRWIFVLLAVSSTIVIACVALWLPETLQSEHRRPFTLSGAAQGARFVLTHRDSLGYTLAGTLSFALLMAYVLSAQQLFADFGVTTAFPLLFAAGAVGMAAASLLNSRLVMHYGGYRLICIALIGVIVLAGLHLIWQNIGYRYDVVVFITFHVATIFFMAFTGPNYAAMAMEAMGRLAGLATSVQGTIQTLGGTLIATIIGQAYDGSPRPLLCGFVLLTGLQIVIVRSLRSSVATSA